MNRSEHQVAGFSSANCGFEGFVIAHFADEHDVGIFTHKCAERIVEVRRVDADFALIDRRLRIVEDVLNRIFNRDDVHLLALIHILNHRRNRGRLARTRDAREEDKSLRGHRHIAENRREVELFKLLNLTRDQTSSEAWRTARHEEIHAEASHDGVGCCRSAIAIVVREVDGTIACEVVELVGIENVLRDLEHFVRIAHGGLEILQHASVSNAWSDAGLHDQITALEPNRGG